MATIAILGTAEVDSALAVQSLDELRDAAAEAGEHFDAMISLRENDVPAVTAEIIDWFIAEEIGYWLIVHPGFADQVPEEYTNAAEKTVKTKDCDARAVAEMLQYQGGPLLVLAGETDQPDEIVAAALVAHEAEVPVLDLADGLTEIPFGEDTQDETGEDAPDDQAIAEEIDFEGLGNDADNGDEDAVAQLTELAGEAGINPDEIATWLEVAEQLYELANAAAGAESNAPDDSSPDTGWTKEALDAKTLKELRAIAAQSGIPDAAKLSMAAAKKALLALDSGEPEPEEKPAAKSKAPGKAVAGPGTGNSGLDHAAAALTTAFTQFINELASAVG